MEDQFPSLRPPLKHFPPPAGLRTGCSLFPHALTLLEECHNSQHHPLGTDHTALQKSGSSALPSTPGTPGRGARRFASVSTGPAHFHPGGFRNACVWRNQTSKPTLVTASPALANASNCQLSKWSWDELTAGVRRPRPARLPT